MKRILALSFCLGLALTQIVHADDKDKHAKRHANKAAVAAQHKANVAHKQNVKAQRNVTAHRNVQAQRNVQVQRNVHAHRNMQAHRNVQHKVQTHQNFNTHHANANYAAKVKAQNNAAAANAARTREFNRHHNKANVVNQNNRSVTRNKVVVRNRNSYYEARNRFNWHHHHDRGWWHHNYPHTRFVIFGGGYYFWNNGYWYPAYGYDPAYSTYTFDEPIYGPNEYEPGRVISDVQIQLQRAGYYYGDVDGLIGPMTRDALARYQADHGLYVTRAIDEPTLEALGLA